MNARTESTMDELPDLRSDADVDALMARLRARVAPPVPSSPSPAAEQEAPGSSDDLAAAQEGLVATMIRAMQTIADALDDLHTDEEPRTVQTAPTSQAVQTVQTAPTVQTVQKKKPRRRTPGARTRKA
jgi:hypothetical protein